ncbi:MAG TPA: hypothetical protein VFT76_00250 [Actinomycetota bacterium]|nr:hypothetical protein [Actinomycetota bacterium]
MAGTIRRWKRGSTVPAIADVLLDNSGAPLNLAGSTVLFRFGAVVSGSATIRGTATLPGGGGGGTVSYAWGTADLGTAGLFYAGWEVRYGAGGTEIFPSGGTIPGEPDWRLVRVTE